jgi:protease IV
LEEEKADMTEYNPVRIRRRRRFLVLLVLALVAVWLVIARPWRPAVNEGSYVLLDLSGALQERPVGRLFERLMAERPPALIELLALIDAAGDDPRLAGIVAQVRSLDTGWARTEEIRNALLAFRKKGKRLIAYLEQEMAGGTRAYYLASAAEKVYVPPATSAPLTGLLAQYTFLGGLWEKVDIEMDVEKIGRYKTAGDMLTRKTMSPDHREMANSLLDSVFDQVVGGIAAGRGIEPASVRAAINAAPATVTELTEARLIDGARFMEDLRVELLGQDRRFLPASDYSSAVGLTPSGSGHRTIAVVYGVGPISLGGSRGGVVDGESMGSDTLAKAFRDAAKDTGAKAIVFRINSPGGSALASDLIWNAVRDAKRKKPVIVSMSDVAGSGGYYVAAGATKIFAEPGTFTGSIGVVAAKPNVHGLLARLGVGTETLSRGRYAHLDSWTDSLDQEDKDRIMTAMRHAYDVFLDRVAEGRGLTRERVDELGQGRVWTGAQARENGLVDDLGGLDAAIQAAKKEAGIPETEKVQLVFYPEPEGFLGRVQQYLGATIEETTPGWWRQLRSAAAAYDFPEGSILTLMPQVVEIH